MLFNLKKNVSNSFKLKPSIFGGLTVSFDPLNLPSYQAGYLMNYTTDVPSGSINPVAVNAQWFDAKILNITSKLMQRGNSTVTGLVNGFKCEHIDTSNGVLTNPTIDVFNGVQNFSFLIGFKRPAATLAYHMLFSCQGSGTPSNVLFSLYTLNTNHLVMAGTNVGGTLNAIVAQSGLTVYNNNAWHVAVVTVDQTNKTINVQTESETFTGVNAAFVPGLLTPDSSGDCRIGQFPNGLANTWSPGYVGDVVIFNTVLTAGEISQCLLWEKTRLGI